MKNKKILLVEDDLDIQDNLKLFLEMEGFEVDSAFNGKEALDYLQKNEEPLLILLDLMMPIMNGYEVLLALRKNEIPVEKYTPIILLSAATDLEETANKQKTQFVRKPISLKLLMQNINNVVEKSL